jgi:hypothetical protein
MDVKSKIRGLFWVSADDASAPRAAARVQPQAQAQPAPAPALSSASLSPASASAASAAAAASGVTSDAAAPDFAAIYARTNSAGDPRVDQVLAAFEAMKAAMPPAQLAIAVGATASAIGADRKGIADTVARRLEAIDAVVASEQRGAAQRQADRASKLAAATAAAQAEIEAAEARIAALRQQLAAATASAQQHDAREQGLATAFEHRAREEAARLVALRDFLARPAAADHR